MEKFIIKETEKAVCVEARFENIILENERTFKIWIPKSCIENSEKGISVKSWFLQNKIKELFTHNASSVMFKGFKIQEVIA